MAKRQFLNMANALKLISSSNKQLPKILSLYAFVSESVDYRVWLPFQRREHKGWDKQFSSVPGHWYAVGNDFQWNVKPKLFAFTQVCIIDSMALPWRWASNFIITLLSQDEISVYGSCMKIGTRASNLFVRFHL